MGYFRNLRQLKRERERRQRQRQRQRAELPLPVAHQITGHTDFL